MWTTNDSPSTSMSDRLSAEDRASAKEERQIENNRKPAKTNQNQQKPTHSGRKKEGKKERRKEGKKERRRRTFRNKERKSITIMPTSNLKTHHHHHQHQHPLHQHQHHHHNNPKHPPPINQHHPPPLNHHLIDQASSSTSSASSSSSSSAAAAAIPPPSVHRPPQIQPHRYQTRSNRLSLESQSTSEHPSSNTINNPPDLINHHPSTTLLPPPPLPPPQRHSSVKTSNNKRRKVLTANTNPSRTISEPHHPQPSPSPSPSPPPLPPSRAESHADLKLHDHIPPNRHHHPRLQSTPKRQKNNHLKSSSNLNRHPPPNPKSILPTELFFTTQRFTTPKANAQDLTTTAILNNLSLNSDPTPSSSPPSPNSNQKTSDITRHRSKTSQRKLQTNSNNRAQDGHHASNHPYLPTKKLSTNHHSGPPSVPSSSSSSSSSSPRPQTPKKNPHIYGRLDRQTDGEMSIITAETPMHHKNREFRRGRTNLDQVEQPEIGTVTTTNQLSSQLLKAFDLNNNHHNPKGSSSRVRRGSRASSIGSGHEALPHPRILPSALCRHIRTDLPPSMRCRTLLSWCSQKAEDVTYTVLNRNFKPTRFIKEELPKPLLSSIDDLINLEPNPYHHLLNRNSKSSKLLIKVAKSAIQSFITGICENQVQISWGHGLLDPSSSPSSSSHFDNHHPSSIVPNLSNLGLHSLPPHPQDLKNEQKIKELDNWKTRMSYEDYVRQFQLNRYGRLIERLRNQKSLVTVVEVGEGEGSRMEGEETQETTITDNEDEVEEEGQEENEEELMRGSRRRRRSKMGRRKKLEEQRFERIVKDQFPIQDLKELLNEGGQSSIVRLGRFLRSSSSLSLQSTADTSIISNTTLSSLPPSLTLPKHIDILNDLHIDLPRISLNVGMISEEMSRLKFRAEKIFEWMTKLQISSVEKLRTEAEEGTLGIGISGVGGGGEEEERRMMMLLESKVLLSSTNNNMISSLNDNLLLAHHHHHHQPQLTSLKSFNSIDSLLLLPYFHSNFTTRSSNLISSTTTNHSISNRDLLRALSRSKS